MWKKSSKCKADSPMCVEVAGLDSAEIMVRDSKLTGKAMFFTFTRDEWEAFIIGVKAGEFDLQ